MRFWDRAAPFVGLVGTGALWWAVSADSESVYFPPLRDILVSFRENWMFARVGSDLVPSLSRFLLGMAFAVAAGVLGGLCLGLSRTLYRATQPQLEFLRSVPPVLLLPASLLVLGTGSGLKVFVIAAGSVWPILLATTAGVRSTDEVTTDMARVFGLGRSARTWTVVLPAALPSVLAGLRTAVPIGLALMVISELVASTNGIGYFILESQQTFDLTAMWSGVLLLGLVGTSLSLLVARLERSAQARIVPTSLGGRS